MATPLTAPRQVKLRRCSVWSPGLSLRGIDGPTQTRLETAGGQDISGSVVSIDIYESIFQNTLSGTVRLRESDGYPELFPLVGTEYLIIEFAIDYQDPDPNNELDEQVFARIFRIRKVGDQSFPKNEERIYALELVSPEFATSISSRMTERFAGTCSEAVKTILKERLHIDDTRLGIVENTSGTIDYQPCEYEIFE